MLHIYTARLRKARCLDAELAFRTNLSLQDIALRHSGNARRSVIAETPAGKERHENIGEFRSTVMAGLDPAIQRRIRNPRWPRQARP
jgi:hypothetical protein